MICAGMKYETSELSQKQSQCTEAHIRSTSDDKRYHNETHDQTKEPAKVNQHSPTHFKRWMICGQETLFSSYSCLTENDSGC